MTDTKKRKGLGRGLDAILQSPDTDITSKDISGSYVAGAIAEIDINLIEANPFQPRTDFDTLALTELAQSIREQGIIQPLTVRKMGYDRYQLISGERRLRASKIAKLTKVPAYVRLANDEQMLEMALIENIHRENLNAIEIAISYQRLIDECNLTQDMLSEKVGKNRSTVANFIRLLKLPPEVQVAIRDGHITMGHARAIINVENKEQQLIILQKIIDQGLNVRQVEELVRHLNDPKTKGKQENYIPERMKQQVNDLSKALNTKVSIKRDAKGKGSLTIKFNNDGDYDRLMDIISK